MLTDSPEKVMSESAKFKALRTVSDVDNVFTLLPEQPGTKNTGFEVYCSADSRHEPVCCEFSQRAGPSQRGPESRPGADPSYKADLIEILQRIRFKMQDQQAEKWGASKPLVGQMVKVKESIDSIVQSLDNSPEALRRLSEYRRRF